MTASRRSLSTLTDRELMERVRNLVRTDRHVTADLLQHLGEVDARRLCQLEAEGSLFEYCVKVLHFSEGGTYKRIAAARAARRYPLVLDMVARGDLHLTAVTILAPHLTDENHAELLGAAVHKTKRQVLKLVAAWFPKPDAPTVLRKLPDPPAAARVVAGTETLGPRTTLVAGTEAFRRGARTTPVEGTAPSAAAAPPAATILGRGTNDVAASTRTDDQPRDRGSLLPLSPGRYRFHVTLSEEGLKKLLRAQELMRHQQPDGNLAVVLERALACFVDELEHRKFCRCKRGHERHPDQMRAANADAPRDGVQDKARSAKNNDGHVSRLAPAPVGARSRTIPRAVRRVVAERDGERCTYVGPNGRRCEGRHCLEYHHIVPWARGGEATVENITLRCRAHNQADAIADFGVEAVTRRTRQRPRARRGTSPELPFPQARG